MPYFQDHLEIFCPYTYSLAFKPNEPKKKKELKKVGGVEVRGEKYMI